VKPNITVPGILECPSLCPANSYAAGEPLQKYTFRTKGYLPAYSYLLGYPEDILSLWWKWGVIDHFSFC
jgi:hypothetical protein